MVAAKCEWHHPPAKLVLAKNDVHVWRACLDCPPSKVKHLKQLLSIDEQKKAERFCFEKDRNRFIIGRGLLRTILGFYLNIEPSQLQFCYGSRGKPYLAQTCVESQLSFNLSHSHGLVLYAFTLHRKIGIDIEQLRSIPSVEQIAKRYFSPQENTALSTLSKSQKQEGFFNAWTGKEAYVKATGEGLALPLNQVEVSVVPEKPAKLLSIKGNSQVASYWSLQRLAPASGYVATLAVEGQGLNTSYWQLSPILETIN